jgi:hypothetical protein
MKSIIGTLIIVTGLIVMNFSCKNTTPKEPLKAATGGYEAPAGLILVANDIISEIIVKPDSLEDPWEMEKVKSFNGNQMFTLLFENIYNKKVVVYDYLSGKPLDPEDVRKMEKEIGTDLSRIAKIQFLEDWYFDPSTSKIIKRLKSASFGYQTSKEEGLPVRYRALFKLKMED